MAEQISLTPKRVSEQQDQQPEMTDEGIDRLLDEAFKGLEIANPDGQVQGPSQQDISPSTPVSNITNSRQTMFNRMQLALQQDPRQTLTMQHTMMIELFRQDPHELRRVIMSIMSIMPTTRMMWQETSPPVIASLQDRLGSDYKISDLLESETLQENSKAKAKRFMEEYQSKPHNFSQLDGNAREGWISMLKVFGVKEQYHEALLAKNDLIVELEIAKYSLLSKHGELLSVIVEFISQKCGEMRTDLSSIAMTNENSLKDLCKDDQFSQISAEITRYLVDHYQLGS